MINVFRSIWGLLTPNFQNRLVILTILTVLAGLVETLSVSLVIPFIAIASGSMPYGKASQFTQILVSFCNDAGIAQAHRTIALGVIFLIVTVISNLFLCAYQYFAANVLNGIRAYLGSRVISTIANKPLSWIENQNSSELTKIAQTDVHSTATLIHCVIQVFSIVTRCLVVYSFLLFIQIRLALTLSALFLFMYSLVWRFIVAPIRRAGEKVQKSESEMFRIGSELIGGSRVVRATATESVFCDRYARAAQKSIWAQSVRLMPGYVTRGVLETTILAIVVGTLVYFNLKDGNLTNGLPLLSGYAVAGIRLLPLVQQSIVYSLDARFHMPSLNAVKKLIEFEPAEEADTTANLVLEHEISLRGLSFSYSDRIDTLRDLNLSIVKNSRVAFVGETGAGKSTLVDLLLGLRFPQLGGVYVDDVQITPSNCRRWRRAIGYVPQSIFLLDSTIAENIAFGFSLEDIDLERVRICLQMANLLSFVDSLPSGLLTEVGERGVRLSGGQCQRIGIARALYHDPQVVIFDEATSALDSQTENSILEAMDELAGRKTLIVVAHRLNTIWSFDRIHVLDSGRIVNSGTSRELLLKCAIFKQLAKFQISDRAQ